MDDAVFGPLAIVGLDLSLTHTGLCSPSGATDRLNTPASTVSGHDRLDEILQAVADWTDVADLVAIEGYSYSSRASQAHAAGELGGLVRHRLWRLGTPYLDVPPACVKKYATGKGNAGKDEVVTAAVRRGADLYTGTTNDEADAFFLWALASDLAGQPVLEVPKSHRAALDKLTMPEGLVAA